MSAEKMTHAEALDGLGFPPEHIAEVRAKEPNASVGTSITGDTDTAMTFLCGLGQKGRRDLIAICPETGAIEGGTFPLRNREQMRAWIEARQGKVGIYYSVNEGNTDKINVKLSKEDIGWIHCVFIDLDPSEDPSKKLDDERARLRKLVKSLAAECQPTWVVDSGNGLQVLWLLDQKIEKTKESEALVEGIGRTLKNRFGGDSAWNIDRILRVPGTINLPNKKKRKLGRPISLAKIIGGTEKPVAIDTLEAWAPPTAANASRNNKWDAKYPNIDMKLVRAANVYDDLPEELLTKFEAACAQDLSLQTLWDGRPADAQTDTSGSGFSFALARLLRLGWRKHGITFTTNEFGMLHWIWEHGQDRDKISLRSIGRDWARVKDCGSREEAACDFDAVDIEEPIDPVARPTITIEPGKLSEIASEAEAALIDAKVPIYVHAEELQRPIIDEVEASKGRRTHVARFTTLTHDALRDQMSRVAKWEKWSERKQGYVAADPPRDVAAIMLSRVGEWKFPPATGVITTPTLRPDGSILSAEGYDPVTRLILMRPPSMPEIPTAPSKDKAVSALRLLDDLLDEFPFVDDASRSVALSELITPVVRGAMSVAPMHANRAPVPGSGKSFLADISAAICIGQPCPVLSAGFDEFELEKRLGAALLAGQPLVSIDNLNGELRGDFLCQMIERPIVKVRPLGVSNLVSIESKATVLATGNNLVLVGDVVRRVVLCSLDPQMERPELRKFTRNPVQAVLGSRGAYIAAALTIVRAYLAAGCLGELPSLASFEDWSRLVRSALVWLGRADPVATMEAARGEDPELEALRRVFAAWHAAVGSCPSTTGRLIEIAQEVDAVNGNWKHPDLHAALMEVAATGGVLKSDKLGRWLKRYRGRIINGLRLSSTADKHSKQQVWRLSDDRQGTPAGDCG
jgi:putative DNA primase/helicase